MVIIDAPYASEVLLSWLEDSQHPVLANAFSKRMCETYNLNLVDSKTAIKLVDDGQSVYTNSENALDWLLENTHNEDRNNAIRLFKDKAAMRDSLAPLNPSFFYRQFTKTELSEIDPAAFDLPVVLKPSVGFCSMGVYVIETKTDWNLARKDIAANEAIWNERYPQSVVDGNAYLIESYLDGEEYAIDIYYDADGKAQILNILRHDFAGADDTSDRLYITNASIIEATYDRFETWLNAVNETIGARDFPVHVEIRMQGDEIVPIEFNPLRFAGLGGTDIAYHAWGFRTYEAYLGGKTIDLKALCAQHPDKTFSMSLLNPSPKADLTRPFNHDAFAQRFSNVLGFCTFDANITGSYGFLFLETDETTSDELDFILHSDLLEFAG